MNCNIHLTADYIKWQLTVYFDFFQVIKLFPNSCQLRKNSLRTTFSGIEKALTTLDASLSGNVEDFECAANQLFKSTAEGLEHIDLNADAIINKFLSIHTQIVEMKAKVLAKDTKLKRMAKLLLKLKRKKKIQMNILREQGDKIKKLQRREQKKNRRRRTNFVITEI